MLPLQLGCPPDNVREDWWGLCGLKLTTSGDGPEDVLNHDSVFFVPSYCLPTAGSRTAPPPLPKLEAVS